MASCSVQAAEASPRRLTLALDAEQRSMQRLRKVTAHLVAAGEDSRRVAAIASLTAEIDAPVGSGRSRLLSEEMSGGLTAEHEATFNELGFVVCRNMLSPSEARRLADPIHHAFQNHL